MHVDQLAKMTEVPKCAILFAATLPCARKLIETFEFYGPNLAKQHFVDRAIGEAEFISERIDKMHLKVLGEPFENVTVGGLRARLSVKEWGWTPFIPLPTSTSLPFNWGQDFVLGTRTSGKSFVC